MNRMKMWLLALILMACGGEAASFEPQPGEAIHEVVDGVPVYTVGNHGLVDLDTGLTLEAPDTGDLGQAEQALLFAPSGSTRQPGFTPGDEVSCVTNNASQNCVVPPMNGPTKDFVYYISGGTGPRIGGGFGVSAYDVYSQLDFMWNALKAQGAYTTGTLALNYRQTYDLNDPELTFVIDVSDSGDFCTGTSSKGNVCFTGSTTGISHNSSLVGTYHLMVNVPVIHIDYYAIANKAGWTTAQKLNALHQAIVMAFEKGIGQGPRDLTGSTRCDQVSVLTGSYCTLPANSACKLNGWGDFGNTSSIRLLGADCGD